MKLVGNRECKMLERGNKWPVDSKGRSFAQSIPRCFKMQMIDHPLRIISF